jgi:hypothetical protein
VSQFVDQVMLDLQDPARLRDLVAPNADSTHERVKQLFAAVFALPAAVLHDVLAVDVHGTQFQRPLFPVRHTSGTWTQTQPTFSRTDLLCDALDLRSPRWLDVSASLALTVALEIDPGEIESVAISEIEVAIQQGPGGVAVCGSGRVVRRVGLMIWAGG